MTDPRWFTGDLPRPDQVSVPVRAVSRALLDRADRLCEDVTQAMLHRRNWDHLILEALVEVERAAENRSLETPIPSEAPTDPNLRLGDVPGAVTEYSTVGDDDIDIVFDLEPSNPGEPSIPPARKV